MEEPGGVHQLVVNGPLEDAAIAKGETLLAAAPPHKAPAAIALYHVDEVSVAGRPRPGEEGDGQWTTCADYLCEFSLVRSRILILPLAKSRFFPNLVHFPHETWGKCASFAFR